MKIIGGCLARILLAIFLASAAKTSKRITDAAKTDPFPNSAEVSLAHRRLSMLEFSSLDWPTEVFFLFFFLIVIISKTILLDLGLFFF